MLSLIHPSSPLCLHQPSSADTILTSSSSSLTTSSTHPTPAVAARSMAPGNPSCLPPPLSNTRTANYKELIAQFTANAPQPYGIIPPRKKLSRASSLTTTKNASSRNKRPSTQTRSSMELMPTATKVTITTTTSNVPAPTLHNSLIENQECNDLTAAAPARSLLLENADHSTSTRLGFWANLKAQYLATTKSFSWSILAGGADSDVSCDKKTFQPPSITNPSPVGASTMATVSFPDALLSLPNLATSQQHTHQQQQQGASYPLSVAAIDRLKPLRTDAIPLKTFTYHETPVVERPRRPLVQSWPALVPARVAIQAKRSNKSLCSATSKSAVDVPSSTPLSPPPSSPACKEQEEQPVVEEETFPLPRHLATRETRSNTDYLRMMAAELRMIRSRKLVSPLKPRGYLPRRKDPFRIVKSSLSAMALPQEEEDYHPLNDVLVGSWSSTCSSASYLSTKSSDYHTASESF